MLASALFLVLPGDIVITEIMYNPDGPTLGSDDLYEWVELCNIGIDPVQLDGMMLSDGGNQLFLEVFELAPMARVVVAADPASFSGAYGSMVPVVQWEGEWVKLSNSSDTLILYSSTGGVIDELSYTDDWGVAEGDTTRSDADGRGSSLEKIVISGGNESYNWAPSADFACPVVDPETEAPKCWGTPGAVNSLE